MSTLNRLVAIFDRFRRNEDGQGLAEYALILALIAIVALIFLGGEISKIISNVGNSM
jgi:Flp pilus assembly pilin Flp